MNWYTNLGFPESIWLLGVVICWKCWVGSSKFSFVLFRYRYYTCLVSPKLNWEQQRARLPKKKSWFVVLFCVGGLISVVCGGLSWSRLLAEEVWGRTSSREHEEAASVSVWEAGGAGLRHQEYRYIMLVLQFFLCSTHCSWTYSLTKLHHSNHSVHLISDFY